MIPGLGVIARLSAAAAILDPAAWDPAKKGASATLSNSNRTLAWNSAGQTTFATAAKSTGKWYAEIVVDSVFSGNICGVANNSHTVTQEVALTTNSWGIRFNTGEKATNSAFTACLPAFAATDILMIAMDAGTNSVWFGRNGTWVGDPAAGTGAAYTGITGPYSVVGGTFAASTGQVTGNWGQVTFSHGPPSGFAAWTL